MHTPLSRRAALKASGIAIALPLLDSMNRAVGREVVLPPKRMVTICNTLGLHPPSLFPKTPGSDYDSTEYLDLLKDHRNDFTLFAGLSHPDQNGKQPHDTEMTWLTAARNPGLGGFKNSISVDQYAAANLGYATRFPSISLSSNTQKSQSYTSNGVMIPAQDRPSTVFAKLFLDGSPEEVRRSRQSLADGRSILDSVAEQTRALNRQTSASDRRQLDEYFDSIRAAEADLLEADAWLDRPKPEVDENPPQDISDAADLIGRARTLMNLVPLCLQTDSSRIITVVIQDHLVVPKIDGVTAEHHNLSHHGQDLEKIKQLKIIETEILKCFADFLSRMTRASEADGRLLDQTSVLFGSNLGNANAHNPSNLPIILAGGGYRHGRYVAYDKLNNTPLCNLFVNVLNNIGIETDTFGTSTGTLEIP
ncbi:hypothetical protein Poly51_61780 [Rubripirellula tenax]|uniref:DUF1552 domain-containing protein n=1 Tax=Rubripirellula tenax TaxID=2528015 RepID=A0A5C6E481_9BACT|nr:DUF1552 domain-containing protein [Rubripirellula tenax]TWU44463.1 hypothetical protein Poly51_61780 [Rubripirellula tenax]